MLRWKPRLVFYLLLPYLLTVPPLMAVGFVLARRALDAVTIEVAGATALQEARSIAERLPLDLPLEAMEPLCREEMRGSVTRLTVIAADGSVLCDTQADATGMVNHLRRPEVVAALRTGSGIARRVSATVHTGLLYSAVKVESDAGVRIVRVALPTEVLTDSYRRLDATVLVMILFSGVVALLPALYIARRIGRRLDRMVTFSRGVAAHDFSTRLPTAHADELGALEANMNLMSEHLRTSFLDMHEETERVQGILRAMVEGVVVISPAGTVMLINRHAKTLFGLPPDVELQGQHLIEMCRDPGLQELLRETTTTGSPQRRREIVLDDAGQCVAVSVSPLGDVEGPSGFVLVFHDITELKRLETIRRDFVANVSHELRTPLTAIRGYAETLRGGALADHARAGQFLEVIERHSERLGRLVDDLLVLSDLELGKTAFEQRSVTLPGLIDDVVDMLGEKAAQGTITIVKDVPGDLPPVQGDGDRLQQVLINLTDNAIKYTPAGGRVTIGARVRRKGSTAWVEVAVNDTGVGIPAQDLPRLTERFYRVDKARSRELGGTGLGLAIVKHIVQAHGGQLNISSELNRGTTVRFSIPAWIRPVEPPTENA